MGLTNYARNHYLAPKVSEFKSADIAPRTTLAERAQLWPTDMAMMSIFLTLNNPVWLQFGYVFFRRASATVQFYEQARLATQEFLQKAGEVPGPAISVYARAVDNWETFLANAEQAMVLLSKTRGGLERFSKNDGSDLQRLNLIHNQSKHLDADWIKPEDSPAEAAYPVWMNSEGLHSRGSSLTWAEATETVDFFAAVVDRVLEELRGVLRPEPQKT